MASPADYLTQTRVACGASNCIATLATICRLLIRVRKSQLWVDDGLAFLSMCMLIIQFGAVLTDPTVLRYYVMANMFYAAIWSARLSILFSIIRVSRTFRRTRALLITAALFLLAWLILTAQIFWECETKTAWKHIEIPQCNLSRAVAICQLISDVAADGVLLFFPIRLFMIIKEKKLRYRMMIIFSTCIVTTVVSVVHAAFLFEAKPAPIIVAAVIENSVSLIVCNIPIIATSILKLYNTEDEDSVPLETFPSAVIPRFGKYSQGASTGIGSSLFSSSISKGHDSTLGSVP